MEHFNILVHKKHIVYWHDCIVKCFIFDFIMNLLISCLFSFIAIICLQQIHYDIYRTKNWSKSWSQSSQKHGWLIWKGCSHSFCIILFPLFKSWDWMMRNLETDLKKTVMSLTYGFSWLQEVILYSKITKVSIMEGSFENDAVILFA